MRPHPKLGLKKTCPFSKDPMRPVRDLRVELVGRGLTMASKRNARGDCLASA